MKRFKWLMSVGRVLRAGRRLRRSSSADVDDVRGLQHGKIGGKLVIDNESGSTWTCQFNPFNPAVLGPGITFGFVYEPLEFVEHPQEQQRRRSPDAGDVARSGRTASRR